MHTGAITFDFGKRHCPHYYLAHYISGHYEDDLLSKSFLGFKRGKYNDLVPWLQYAKQEIQTLNLPKNGLIVRALHRYEAGRDPFKNRPLDYLGKALAYQLAWTYTPTTLFKLEKNLNLKDLSKNEREYAMLFNYAVIAPYPWPQTMPVLIIDDICTTGATLAGILDAFCRFRLPDQIFTFTLAKSERDITLNQDFHFKCKEFEWSPAKGWLKLP